MLVLVRWLGDCPVTVLTTDGGRLLIETGDTFEMPEDEAAVRPDVAIVDPITVEPTTEPSAPLSDKRGK